MEQVPDHNTAQFEELASHLAKAPEGNISVVSYAHDSFVYDILEQLREHEVLQKHEHTLLDWRGRPISSLEMELQVVLTDLEETNAPQVWHIWGLPNSLIAEVLEGKWELLGSWNEEGEVWEKIPASICLWLDPYSLSRFEEEAPLLWQRVSRVFTFVDAAADAQADSSSAAESEQIAASETDPAQRATALLEAGLFEQALVYANQAIQQAESEKQFLNMARAYQLKARIYERQGDWLEAVRHLHTARGLSQAVDHHAAEIRFRIANILATVGLTDLAKSWYEALTEIKASDALEVVAKSHRNLGVLYINEQEADLAFSHYGQALDDLEEAEAWESLAFTHEQVADVFVQLQQIDDAIEHHEAAAHFFDQSGNTRQQAFNYMRVARLYEYKGLPEKALQAYELARQGLEAAQDRKELLECLQKMGGLQQDQLNWQEALSHFQAALPLARALQDDFAIDALEDSIEEIQEKIEASTKKKKGLLGGLFGK